MGVCHCRCRHRAVIEKQLLSEGFKDNRKVNGVPFVTVGVLALALVKSGLSGGVNKGNQGRDDVFEFQFSRNVGL